MGKGGGGMDDRITELLSAGDQEGIALLQKQYGNMVRYIVRGILRDEQDVEECVSDVYLRVWDRFGTFRSDRGSLAAWVTAVAATRRWIASGGGIRQRRHWRSGRARPPRRRRKCCVGNAPHSSGARWMR